MLKLLGRCFRRLPAEREGVLKIVATTLLLTSAGCSMTKGFTEATYNHLNQGTRLNHAEYQQERGRITGENRGVRP